MARFSKVAKEASIVEVGIWSLTTNEQSRIMERRSSACRDSESSALLRFRVLYIDVLASDNANVLIREPRLKDGGVMILWP